LTTSPLLHDLLRDNERLLISLQGYILGDHVPQNLALDHVFLQKLRFGGVTLHTIPLHIRALLDCHH